MWANLMGCNVPGVDAGSLDLDVAVDGEESHILRFPNCKDGSNIELVTMDHVGHMLWKPTPLFAESTWDFLKTHRTP